MRVNTPESIVTARRVHARFGSWRAAREAAVLLDGVYVLPVEAGPVPEEPAAR